MIPRRLFHIRDYKHLWDDSSDDEKEEKEEMEQEDNRQLSTEIKDPSQSRIIAVSTQTDGSVFLPLPPPPPSSPLSKWPLSYSNASFVSTEEQQQQIMAPYIPKTLKEHSRRYSILPAYPTSIYNDQPTLLLANVPQDKLNSEQLARRQRGVYPLIYTINKAIYDIPSYFHHNYQSFISSLIYQYNIDESILDYNLYRFSECFRLFADDSIRRHGYFPRQFELDEIQKKYAFEFYLQIDVDVFFMKTCSFRQARPRSADEYLFCINEPDMQYGLSPCHNCPLCVPSYDNVTRRGQAAIRFGPNQSYRFLNGYHTILNCPATCHTQSIIYAMTCPCNEFEYIGETSLKLNDRLWYHRQHYNRIIHEFLIGEGNVQISRSHEKDQETLVKDRMLLYKHVARCPNAIQLFLNFNPIYWCFIPITLQEAVEQNENYILPTSLVLLDSIIPTSIGSKDRRAIQAIADTRSDETVRSCMRHLPPLPPGYTFSIRQRTKQFQYFKDKLDFKVKQDETIDLFNVAIIAVLPVDASHIVRRFVESLFITHTETKLNTSGRLLHQNDGDDRDHDNTNNYPMSSEAQMIDRGDWCRNVTRR